MANQSMRILSPGGHEGMALSELILRWVEFLTVEGGVE